VLARTSIDRAYFGTDTRAAELLVGVLLAVALLGRIRLDARPRRVAVAAGTVGAVTLVALVGVAHLSSPWLYPWGLLLTAACTGAVIVAALQHGAMARVLELAPLVALGRISYGVYLLHWPVFLWLTPMRTGLDGPILFALRIAVTLTAAIAMYRWVEQPVRSRRLVTWRQARVLLPCAAVLLLVGDVWITSDVPGPPEYLVARAPGDVRVREAPSTTSTTEGPTSPTTLPTPEPAAPAPTTAAPAPTAPTVPANTAAPAPRHPRRVLLVGDSVAASIEDALGDALTARGITFAAAAAPGCGILTGDPADADGNPSTVTAACNGAIPRVQRDAVRKARPDLVVALSTWETTDRIVDGRWYQVGTPEWTGIVHRLYGEAIQRLSAGGARVALLTIADVVDGATLPGNADTNRRAAFVNDVLRTIGTTAPGVETLPFDQIVCPTTPCPLQVDGITLRPRDGRHFDQPPGQRYVAGRLATLIAALDLDHM
ncbi:MAG: acyltransferase, partial [Actinobacteria bacterium]|nr:acyltransferase [Actinomycetota bacterium]